MILGNWLIVHVLPLVWEIVRRTNRLGMRLLCFRNVYLEAPLKTRYCAAFIGCLWRCIVSTWKRSSQLHLISPGCPRPNSALIVQKGGLKTRSSIHPPGNGTAGSIWDSLRLQKWNECVFMKNILKVSFLYPRPLPASPLLHCQNCPFVKTGSQLFTYMLTLKYVAITEGHLTGNGSGFIRLGQTYINLGNMK